VHGATADDTSVESKRPLASSLFPFPLSADAPAGHRGVSAFVSPKWVPQDGDAAEGSRSTRRRNPYTAMVPHLAGLDRGDGRQASPRSRCSHRKNENLSRKHINQSIDESLASYAQVLRQRARIRLSVPAIYPNAFGCRRRGGRARSAVADVARGLAVARAS